MSLEPGLVWTVKISPTTFTQNQVAWWIPVGGDPDYDPCFVFHYHFSVNQLIAEVCPDVLLVGTVELNGYSVPGGDLEGAATDPVTGAAVRDGSIMISAGPGLRLMICDKVDIGAAAAFALTKDHFEEELYRIEVRWRF